MSKPSWDEAPDWANWLAMDEDYFWHWHANKPFFDFAEGCWFDPDPESECFVLARSAYKLDVTACESLESRP